MPSTVSDMAFAKTMADLKNAWNKDFTAMSKDGTVDKIFVKYGLTPSIFVAIRRPRIQEALVHAEISGWDNQNQKLNASSLRFRRRNFRRLCVVNAKENGLFPSS